MKYIFDKFCLPFVSDKHQTLQKKESRIDSFAHCCARSGESPKFDPWHVLPKKGVVDGQWMFNHPFSSPINIGKSWITNHQSWNILRITWKILSCRSHDLRWPGSWNLFFALAPTRLLKSSRNQAEGCGVWLHDSLQLQIHRCLSACHSEWGDVS